MLSKDLEILIDAAIADGKITEKEREVLVKRAKEEGVDLEEFELILESRLHSKNNVPQEKESDNQPKEFVVRKLQSRIDDINKDYENKVNDIESDYSNYYIYVGDDKKSKGIKREKNYALLDAEIARDNSVLDVIENLYIPINKDDIIDLLNYLIPATKENYYCPYGSKVQEALKSKFNVCMEIARQNFPDVPEIKEYIDKIAKEEKEKEDKIRQTEEELSRQTVTRLKKDIEEAKKVYYEGSYDSQCKKKSKAVEALIQGFQLPEDRKDLLELIKYFKPFYNKKVWKDRDKNYKREAQACYDKYLEACELAKSLFPNDSEFQKEFPQEKKKGLFSIWLGN